jgi:esterase/lipase
MESITLHTSDGLKLSANYYEGSKHAATIILLHSLRRSKDDYKTLAEALYERGFGVIALDFRGHGESEGNWNSFLPQDYNNMVFDVLAAREYLKQRQANYKKLAIIGSSIGANVALRFAATQPDVKTVILLSCGIEYHGISAIQFIGDYGSRPLLIATSEDDQYSAESSEKLSKQATGVVELIKFHSAGHGNAMLEREPSLTSSIFFWLSLHCPV